MKNNEYPHREWHTSLYGYLLSTPRMTSKNCVLWLLPWYKKSCRRMPKKSGNCSMADMVGAAGAALSPLAALLHRELINRPVVHADETPLKLLNTKKGGKSCSGYLWAYVSGKRTGPSVVCFDCRTGRSHEYPENWLQGWSGTLIVDGHKAYRTLANKVPEIMLAGCWDHARRASPTCIKSVKIHGLP